MSRSNYDKPFYTDVGTSIVAIRCASNHDVIVEYDFARFHQFVELAKKLCDRLNKEVEIGRPRRNCDVGTVAEQTKRLRANCERFKPTCKGCKCFTDIQEENCWLKWAQMPYEVEKEGGAE